MIKITKDRGGKLRFSIYAKNGNHLCSSTRGYNTIEDVNRIIDILRSGEYEPEIETANRTVKNGHAVYFMLFSPESGEKLAVSPAYISAGHRRTWQQANLSADRTIRSLCKYLDKVVIID